MRAPRRNSLVMSSMQIELQPDALFATGGGGPAGGASMLGALSTGGVTGAATKRRGPAGFGATVASTLRQGGATQPAFHFSLEQDRSQA